MLTAYLAITCGGSALGALSLSSIFNSKLNGRLASGLVLGGIGLALGGCIFGILSVDESMGQLGLALSAASGGICGTGYLFYSRHRRVHYRVGGPDIEIMPVGEGEQEPPPPDEGGNPPVTPPPPPPTPPVASTEPSYTCTVSHLSGWTFLHMVLRGGDWRKTFNVNFMLYVRGQRMDFYMDGTGSEWYGITSRNYKVNIRHNQLYKDIKCIDDCSKILVESWGTPSKRDGLLVAGYQFDINYLDSMDTVYITAEIAAGMEGSLSFSTNLEGTPSVGASETSTGIASGTGANAFKCIKVSSSGASPAQ